MDNFDFKYKSKITNILPNTKRTQDLLKKQREEEERRLQNEQNAAKAAKEKEKEYKAKQKEHELKRKQEEEKRKEEQKKAEEEKQQVKTLKGRFGNMIKQLDSDKTPLEFTITGLSLLPAQIRILVQFTNKNQTLRTLTMCRKGLTDGEGIEIARCLRDNKTLESIDLEGNLLGPKTAEEIGKALLYNTTVRNLNLEGNNLTAYQAEKKELRQDNSGILAIAAALSQNRTLLYLNLNSTELDATCGENLKNALEENNVLILLDIERNPRMNLHDVRAIQDLQRDKNYAEYKEERFKEFIERRRLKREEDISAILDTKAEAVEMIKQGINQRMEIKKIELEKEWNQMLIDEEIKKQKEMQKLEKTAKLRIEKNNRKRRPKPEKKKK